MTDRTGKNRRPVIRIVVAIAAILASAAIASVVAFFLLYLANLGITVDDLERHGPGLVLDMTGGSVAMLPAADAIIGTHAIDSQMLIWTE